MLWTILHHEPIVPQYILLGNKSFFQFIIIFFTFIYAIYFQFKNQKYAKWMQKEFPKNLPFTKENLMMAYMALAVSVMFYNRREEGQKIALLRRFIRERNGHVPADFDQIVDIFLHAPIHPVETTKWIQQHAKEGTKIVLMKFLVQICLVDKTLNTKEYEILKYITTHFQIPIKELDQWINEQRGSNQQKTSQQSSSSWNGRRRTFEPHESVKTESLRDKHLKVLGLTSNAQPEQIKSSYRKLVKVHHPDRFAKSSKSEQEAAHKKFLEIQTAYDFLNG